VIVCHLAERSAWAGAQRADDRLYRAPSLQAEGFIHCSFPEQLAATAARYYAGRADLTLLRIDADHPAIAAALVVEATVGAEPFPHVYAAIPVAAVVSAEEIAVPS
jgi:uncharacterized protein (DUF952 family)